MARIATRTGLALKKLLLILALLVIVLIAVVIFAVPPIAGALGKGIVERSVSDSIQGRVELDSLSVSWLGSQRVSGFMLYGVDGQEIATGEAVIGAGLVPLALGSRDLGEIALTISATATELPEGGTDLQQAIASANPAPPSGGGAGGGGAATLPSGLAARVTLVSDRLLYVPRSGEPVGLTGVRGTVGVAAGEDASIDLDATTVRGSSLAPDGGTIDLIGSIQDWSHSSGTLTMDAATVDLTLTATDLPVDAIDALAQLDGRGERSLGDRVTITASARGTLEEGVAQFQVTSASGARGSGSVEIADGVAVSERDFEFVVPVARLVAADESLAEQLTGEDAAFRLEPEGSLSVRVSDVSVPTTGGSFREARATIDLTPPQTIRGELTRTNGTKALVEARGVSLTGQLVGGVVQLTGGGAATVGGVDGGSFELAASTGSIVNANGSFAAPDLDAVMADLAIRGLDTALLDPLLASVSDGALTAAGSIGPRLDAEIEVQPADAAGDRTARIMAKSQRLNADGLVLLNQQSIRTTEPLVVRATDQATGREGSLQIVAQIDGLDQPAPRINATLESQAFPTAWLSPIVAALQDGEDLRLVQRVGPVLDGSASALIDGETATPDPVRLSLRAQHLTAEAALELRDEVVQLAPGTTLTLTAARASGLASAFAPSDIVLAEQGTVRVTLEELVLPMGAEDLLASARAQGRIEAANWSASIADAGSVGLPNLSFDLSLAEKRASITGGGAITSDGGRGTIDVSIASGIPADTTSPDAWRSEQPTGTITLKGLPLALAEQFGVSSGIDGVSLRELAGGPTVDATLALRPDADTLRLETSLDTQAISSRLDASLSGRTARVETLTTNVDASLAMLRSITRGLMPDNELAPRLQEPGRLELSVQPFEIPLTDSYTVDTATLGDRSVSAQILLSGDFKSFNTTAIDESGASVETFRSGPIVLDKLKITADAPIASLLAGGADPIELAIVGPIRNRGGLLIVDLDANADVALTPMAVSATVAANTISTEWTQDRVGVPQLSSLLGAAPSLRAGIELAEGADGVEPRTASLAITGDQFTTTDPLRVAFKPAGIELASPMRATWNASPDDLAALLGDGGTMRFATSVQSTIEIAELVLPSGDGPPRVVARVGTTPLAILDSQSQPQEIGTLSATVRNRASDASVVEFNASIARRAAGDTPLVALDGTINGLGGDATPGITGTARVNNAPTALIDALAMQNGLLGDILGDSVNAGIDLANVPASGGTVTGELRSPFATMSLDGVFQNDRFTLTKQSGAQLSAFSAGLNRRLSAAMPLVGGVTKSPDDGPAFLRLNTLSYPLDGDLSKLNADVTLDIGEATVTASELFGPVLGLANWRTATAVGQRLEPVNVRITDGVAKYDTVKIPLGEFVVETTGSIDLGKRQQDLVFYIPFGALSQEVAGSIRSDFASQLNRVPGLNIGESKLPFVLRGSLDGNNQPQLDMQMFFEQTVGDALQPENLLRGILQEGLRRGGGE